MKLYNHWMTTLGLTSLCLCAAAAAAGPPDGVPPEQTVRPIIKEAHVDAAFGLLSILGHGLSPDGNVEIFVRLGGPQGVGDGPEDITALCSASEPMDQVIECDLGIMIMDLAPGDYVLTVRTSGGRSNDFPVAFGEVGPKGLKGAMGDKGDPGDRGDKGDTGDTGDKGPKGDTGDQGAPGTFDTGAITTRMAGFVNTVFCANAGDVVIGGGGVCLSFTRRAVVDRPILNADPPGWEYICGEAGLEDNPQQVWVTCASP